MLSSLAFTRANFIVAADYSASCAILPRGVAAGASKLIQTPAARHRVARRDTLGTAGGRERTQLTGFDLALDQRQQRRSSQHGTHQIVHAGVDVRQSQTMGSVTDIQTPKSWQ
jgi:hypothetical protein